MDVTDLKYETSLLNAQNEKLQVDFHLVHSFCISDLFSNSKCYKKKKKSTPNYRKSTMTTKSFPTVS